MPIRGPFRPSFASRGFVCADSDIQCRVCSAGERTWLSLMRPDNRHCYCLSSHNNERIELAEGIFGKLGPSTTPRCSVPSARMARPRRSRDGCRSPKTLGHERLVFTETKIGFITERASDQTVCPSAGHELELTLLRNRLHRRADRDGVRWNIGRAVGVRKAEGLLQCWLRLALDRRDGLLAHRARGLDSRSHLSRIRGAALSPLAYPS